MSKNKLKSRKSAVKRFKITGSGKIVRRVSFGRHLRNSKSKGQLRKYKSTRIVSGKIGRRIRRLMALA
jgi:large subunit ribosomal protein L35